jgi:lysophospholipase
LSRTERLRSRHIRTGEEDARSKLQQSEFHLAQPKGAFETIAPASPRKIAHGERLMSKRLDVVVLILAAALAACSPAPVGPGKGAGAARYDGSSEAFAAFAAEQDQDWPTPAEMGRFKAPDGALLRYARWTPPEGPSAGTVVFFQGRTEFIEKNIYAYKDLSADGYDVWTLDWRGQGLSHRPLNGTDKGYIDRYESFVADATHFINEVVKLDERPGPKILLAHSMGGGIGALYLMQNPDRFDRAVFSSPLMRLPSDQDRPAVRLVNKAKVATGLGSTCAGLNPFSCPWTDSFGHNVDPCTFKGATPPDTSVVNRSQTERYTHDLAKAALIDCMVARSLDPAGSDPGLAVGGATSSWLRATLLATDTIAVDPKKLQTPLLIVGAGRETVVSNDGQQAFCTAASPNCCWVKVEGAGHEILIESEEKRREFMDHFRRFVTKPWPTAEAFCTAAERQTVGAS